MDVMVLVFEGFGHNKWTSGLGVRLAQEKSWRDKSKEISEEL